MYDRSADRRETPGITTPFFLPIFQAGSLFSLSCSARYEPRKLLPRGTAFFSLRSSFFPVVFLAFPRHRPPLPNRDFPSPSRRQKQSGFPGVIKRLASRRKNAISEDFFPFSPFSVSPLSHRPHLREGYRKQGELSLSERIRFHRDLQFLRVSFSFDRRSPRLPPLSVTSLSPVPSPANLSTPFGQTAAAISLGS